MEPESQKFEFHNIKVPDYQTQHADGALGGLTPNGLVYVCFYLERLPTPQRETMYLSPTGDVEKVETDGKSGFIREINAGVVMTSEVAETLIGLLRNLVAASKDSQEESNPSRHE